jgi:DNA-binding NarL/FixJ family response regulator
MRVVVADDMLLVREGLVRVLTERGIEVVGQAGSSAGLLELVDAERPDVAIVDIRMPPDFRDEGLVAAADIRTLHPEVAVLVLSQHLELSYALRLVQSAPERVGYLLKDRVVEVGMLVDSLRRLCAGDTVIDPAIVSRVLARRRSGTDLASLTARELEVLALIAEGCSNRAIAGRLSVNDRTVEAHTAAIMAKLGIEMSDATHRRVLAVLAYLRT